MADQNIENRTEPTNCPIWPDFQATRHRNADGEIYVDSPRAGGSYLISPEAVAKLEESFTLRLRNDPRPGTPRFSVSEFNRIRLTTWLIDQWSLTDMEPFVTPQVIESIRRRRRLPAHERANRLLRLIAQNSPAVGKQVVFHLRENASRHHEPTLRALAWSESDSLEEIQFLARYLEQNGWLQCVKDPPGYQMGCTVTVDGYTEIARRPARTESTEVFIAMSFHDSIEDAYRQGIEPAIRVAGYEPVRIDNVEHAGLIEDAIIAAIRRARFVVCDSTPGDDGARGSVYYEAGFAHGLDLTVIFTCRHDKLKSVHFDTSHFNHIAWTGYEDLKTRLQQRIERLFGRGPWNFPPELRRNTTALYYMMANDPSKICLPEPPAQGARYDYQSTDAPATAGSANRAAKLSLPAFRQEARQSAPANRELQIPIPPQMTLLQT